MVAEHYLGRRGYRLVPESFETAASVPLARRPQPDSVPVLEFLYPALIALYCFFPGFYIEDRKVSGVWMFHLRQVLKSIMTFGGLQRRSKRGRGTSDIDESERR